MARVASNSIRKFISPIPLKTFYFCCARNCIALSCSHSILIRGSYSELLKEKNLLVEETMIRFNS